MSEDKLKGLKRQRASYKAQLTRLHNTILASGDTEDIDTLNQRYQKLEEICQGFDKLQLEIESLEDETDNENTRDEFEKRYFKCSIDIRACKRRVSSKSGVTNLAPVETTSMPSVSNPQTILPKIQIKPFDGSFLEWNSFFNMFCDLVHNNKSLPIVHKFHLLKSYLRGDASIVIEALSASEENYLIAWNLLQKRFNNPRKIIHAHIQALFDLPEVSSNNSATLRILADKVEMHVNALRSLEEPVDWHEMIIFIVTAKLDKTTRTHWERSIEEDERPKIKNLLDFLNRFARDSEPSNLANYKTFGAQKDKVRVSKRTERTRHAFVSSKETMQCPVCQNKHFIQNCGQFLKLEPRDRLQEVKGARLCINCFRPDHTSFQCRSGVCRQCKKRHNTLLHFDNAKVEQASASETVEQSSTSNVTLISNVQSEVLLSTARIIIFDRDNKEHECRILLDSGSQSNFITERLAKQLRLNLQTINMPVSGLGEQNNSIRHYVKTKVKSRCTNFLDEVSLLVLPTITGRLPSRHVDKGRVRIPANIVLADPEFYKPSAVDVLLGEHLFYKLLCVGQIRLPNEKCVLQRTRLGWLVSGRVGFPEGNTHQTNCFLANNNLEQQVAKFWEVEECTSQRYLSVEEQICEEHYQVNTCRDSQGRYIVRLAFNNNAKKLGDSYKGALRRLYSLERRLESQPGLRQQYKEFMSEYKQLGHMIALQRDVTDEGFYLPHHAVVKVTSNTTKLRVVFDASAKSTSGVSLNDALLVGPSIQDDIFELVARFRLHNYVLTADIEKMFRQIRIHPDDAKFQKILWRDNPSEAIQTFVLDTVTYGTSSAPFLAVRTLRQLARDEGQVFPLAATALENDFYMDDLITGADTLPQAIKLRNELDQLLKLGGFNLRQWASNDPSLIEDFGDRSENIIHFNASETKKTLGICWDSRQDTISYSVRSDLNKQRVTKRTILSTIAQLFDPLGILGPVIVLAKIIMQELWKVKLGWDETVPPHIYTDWTEYLQQLPLLNNFKIMRKVRADRSRKVQLHGFSDASEKAYGACIYLRSVNEQGSIVSNLICAKSRIAPLKCISLPRLELCAAVLLVKLYCSINKTLKIKFEKIKFWSDSTIALQWINSEPHILKTFVANRVAEVQRYTSPKDWSHVPSTCNPADFISRGQRPRDFLQNQMWLKGPSWLVMEEGAWPNEPLPLIPIPERRATVVLTSQISLDKNDIFHRFSSFEKLLRVIAYCFRFSRLASRKYNFRGELSVDELQHAHDSIIRRVQSQAFSKELHQLQTNKTVVSSSKLISLNPFIDDNYIIRVGGRLKNADIEYAQRHPILLPKSHPVTALIILRAHNEGMHAGVQGTLNAVRQKYWVIDGRNCTRFIVRKCVRCFRVRPAGPPKYLMGDLPRDRLIASRPFENVGVDYCGPLFVKERRYRNQGRIKTYVAVFVCFLTKAVHLELVSDLTTEAFLGALKRFFTRRGKAKNIYSDNGTNFVGANNQLSDLFRLLQSKEYNTQVIRYLNSQAISWHFAPPNSPHFGGLWEAAVKSFKYHLMRTVGDTLLTFEQLNTYVIEIEGILNSRPLTPLSSDPNDLQALTPAHFLIGESLIAVPERNFTAVPDNRLSLWQHIQKLKQHFWIRWHKEYINELNVRSRWKQGATRDVQVNDLVLLRDDALPPLRWSLGRVIEAHPGKDGVTRVASVRTINGVYKRAVKRLCVLPIESAS